MLLRPRRVQGMLEEGDLEGCAYWTQILRAIDEIRRMKKTPDESVH